MTGCNGPEIVKQPQFWYWTNYNLCDLNLNPNLGTLPENISMTLNRTNLSFGRYDDQTSMRPWMVYAKDNSVERIGDGIIDIQHETSLEFAGTSADGSIAYIDKQWEDPQNGMIEQLLGAFRYLSSSYLTDVYSYDLKSKTFQNLTSSNRVSFFNTGIFNLPNSLNTIGFTSLIGSDSEAFTMNLDGSNKKPLSTVNPGFTYGATFSPDGTKFAFHSDYIVYIGDSSTGTIHAVNTPCSFNFLPTWSKDSQWVSFFCGDSNIGPDIYITDRNGLTVEKFASRNGYSGANPFIDTEDFHGGSSDYTIWTDHSLIYAAMNGSNVELFEVDINSRVSRQLTFSSSQGSHNYYPDISLDDHYVIYVSTETGVRQAKYLNLDTLESNQITNIVPGCGVFIPKWRPIFN